MACMGYLLSTCWQPVPLMFCLSDAICLLSSQPHNLPGVQQLQHG